MYHILIVDDEPLICKGLSNLLQESDLDIASLHIAHSGPEALDYFRMEEIDLILTDIQMGEMSGLELVEQALLIRPRLLSIIITAHDSFPFAQQAIRLGVKDYIVKPIDNRQLIDTVSQVLSQIDRTTELEQEAPEHEEEYNANSNQIVEKTRQFLEAHYDQKGLTLHEVAIHNHVSPNYLSYLFKKNTGFNLWEYVIKLRMEESKRLILTTDMRRYEIADRVGYESPEHFSKIFKKYYGISPSDLKK